MDETAYRQKYAGTISRPCVFRKALLARRADCARVRRVQLAEREGELCLSAFGHGRCSELYAQLRHSFMFAIGRKPGEVLTHGQEMRVQCGGLMGLQQVLWGDCEVKDVDGLTEAALQQWGTWDAVPWSEVVHAAALCYKGRRG